MNDSINNELNFYLNHIKENAKVHQASSDIENTIYRQLSDQGFVFFNTPIIHHGIHEYNGPTAEVITGVDSSSRYFLRQSAQFEKQLIVMAGQKPYFQKSFCFRPGEDGKFHVPYHNQIDMELPFKRNATTMEEAKENVISIALGIIGPSLAVGGKEIENIGRISYERAMDVHGNDSPYIAPIKKNGINIMIIENPPLLKNKEGALETVIHPMAQPIFTLDQEERFISGKMDIEEMKGIRVYGYDIVASSPGMFETGEVTKGLEIGGGSVRIKNPDVQKRIVELTLPQYTQDYIPLVGLLSHFKETDDFSAGAAVGLERLVMTTMDITDVKKALPLPWHGNRPAFGHRPT